MIQAPVLFITPNNENIGYQLNEINYNKMMDGVEGFEPPNSGTKNHGLTAWRYPSI
jgi:hypothetical protein